MANVKISELPSASTLTGAELVPIVQSGVTSQTTLSAMPYVPTGTGAVTTTVQTKLRETVSVKDFGAVGDGVTDDTAAIQAAINSLTSNQGGTVFIPHGYYKVTSTINVGLPTLTGYSFITSRTSEMTDPTIAANTISANVTANQAKKHVDIVFDAGATLVASWTPASEQPVIAYNLAQGTAPGHGRITNATIVSSTMITSGVYNQDATLVPQTNNLIGIFSASGCKHIDNTFISGIEHGIVLLAGYWTRTTDLRVWRAGGRCLDIAAGNALKVDNLAFWYSARGLVFDGEASEIRGIHTEQVAQEIIIFQSNTCIFGPAYLEDVETTSGAGTYAVTLGQSGGSNKVIETSFNQIRVGSVRPSKQAYRIWDTQTSVFEGCRAYGNGYVKDAISSINLISCDFAPSVPTARISSSNGGFIDSSCNSPSGSGYSTFGPWTFNVSGIATGSIASGAVANYDYVLPSALDGVNTATAFATYTSGGNAILSVNTRILFTTPRKIRISFGNMYSSAIDPGTFSMALTVFGGI